MTIVQLRDKTSDTAELIRTAKELHEVTKQYNVPLLVNDRVDVALAAGVEGVHIGQDDMGESILMSPLLTVQMSLMSHDRQTSLLLALCSVKTRSSESQRPQLRRPSGRQRTVLITWALGQSSLRQRNDAFLMPP